MEVVSKKNVEVTNVGDGFQLRHLAQGENTGVMSWSMEPGTKVDEHTHPQEQAGFIINGTLTFVVDGEEIEVREGDSYVIPSGKSHSAYNGTDQIVKGVDVLTPPRKDSVWDD